MKRIIICCDGTWQKLSNCYPTNVVKIAQAIKPLADDGTPQIIFYEEGVGTGYYKADKVFGGVLGWGIDKNIQDAYRFLCLNYDQDDEIYLYGFSRGAYTVRSLAGLINCAGLLKRNKIRQAPRAYELYRKLDIGCKDPEAVQFRKENGDRVPIKFLGCWDTVGSLGIPEQIPLIPVDEWINEKYNFHNTSLSAIIQNAYHAMAIDERRKMFDAASMKKCFDNSRQNLVEMWFPGDHACVGGGSSKTSGLSDGALQWMINQSKTYKLEFDESKVINGIKPDPTVSFDNTLKGIYRLTRSNLRNISDNWLDLHESVIQRWIETNTDTSAESQKTNSETNLPYNPENLIYKHGERLGQERSKYLARLNDQNPLSGAA